MREIKFRAWDKKAKRFESEFAISSLGSFMRLGIGQKQDNIILMQYTGLKDKNGVEIWESDILTYPALWNGEEHIVSGEVVQPDGCWIIKEISGYERGCIGNLFANYEIEVIGNIYENPERLTASKGG